MNTLTQPFINAVRAQGYTVTREGAGWAVVADPVLCTRGPHRWTEHKFVTLRSDAAASRFMVQRS